MRLSNALAALVAMCLLPIPASSEPTAQAPVHATAPASDPAASGWVSPLPRLAPKTLLLAGTRHGALVIVAGSRGIVMVSSDSGQSWQMVNKDKLAEDVTFTAITCPADTAAPCHVAGHGGSIARVQLPGDNQPDSALVPLRFAPEDQAPVMAVLQSAEPVSATQYGLLAVGAYGLNLSGMLGEGASEFAPVDGLSEIAEEAGSHMNAIIPIGANKGLLVAGELGGVWRQSGSTDEWEDLSVDYDGSMFNALALKDGGAIVFGLQGKVFRLDDALTGTDWVEVVSGTGNGLMGGTVLADGTVVLVGANGAVAISTDHARSFAAYSRADRQSLSDVVEAPDGHLILLGEHGATRVSREELGK